MAAAAPNPARNILQAPEDDDFKSSYEHCQEYPENLVYQTTYPAAAKADIAILNDAEAKLFTKAGFKIPFRDYIGHGPNGGFDKLNVSNEEELKERLGDLTSATPAGEVVTKKDPKCRFIFFSAEDSREPLQLNRRMLLRILSYHQVMSGFLEFLYTFGEKSEKNEARDLRYSGFREQTTIKHPLRKYAVPNIGRSGRQFQLCYNLKSVVRKPPKPGKLVKLSNREWSIRQGAFHHQFDIQEGTTLWIVVHGRPTIKERVQELTGDKGRPQDREFGTPAQSLKSSLATHLLYCHWSTEGWRWYVQWLEEVVEEKTDGAIHERRGTGDDDYEYTPKDVQSVQYYEDKIREAIMVLEANTVVLTSLRKFYQQLLRSKDFSLKATCKEDIDVFATQIDSMINDARMHIARAQVLVQITEDRKSLILQHLQSQATEKMELLTLSMHKMGHMAQKESIAMRIITVVTLIYLPATFVSTFFSTDVIKYQNQGGGDGNSTDVNSGPYMGSFSSIAMNRWLQVSLPLTALTLGLGYWAFKIADKDAKQKLEKLGLLPFYEQEAKSNQSSWSSLKWIPSWCIP